VQVGVSESGFDPASISVPVGGTVTFTPSDEGPHGIYVGDLDGYTAMGGLTATFRFDIAGTYTVYDEISEASATVTAG
jgi:plastocyanin